jgi:4-aminobutyrate aminotransferase
LKTPDGNVFLDATPESPSVRPDMPPGNRRSDYNKPQTLIHMCGTIIFPPNAALGQKTRRNRADKRRPKRISPIAAGSRRTALNLAMYHTRRQKFISFFGSFHGERWARLSLTSSKKRSVPVYAAGARCRSRSVSE